jgi:hypothetical protein
MKAEKRTLEAWKEASQAWGLRVWGWLRDWE